MVLLGHFRRSLALCALAALATSSHAAAAAAASSSSSGSQAIAVGDLAWVDCGTISNVIVNAVVQTECTTFAAPLCHAGVCEDAQNRSVNVYLRRIRATNAVASSPSVWLLQGGAGTTSTGFSEAMSTLYAKLNGSAHIYTMDQRGSGLSTRFECLNATTSQPLPAASVTGVQVVICAQQLEQKFGKDLSAFSVTSAASDVASFIAKYHGSAKSFVYGVSYGSVVAERLLHLNPVGISGYVLDAVRTTSGASLSDFMYESNAATDFGDVADQLIDACAGSVNCFGKFATVSLRAMLEKMYSDFGAGLDFKCASFVGTTGTQLSRQQFFAQLLRMFLAEMYVDEFAKGLIPAFVYRMNRCTDADHEVLTQFLQRGLPQLRAKFDESEYTASLLYRLITFSEMWESPTPSAEVMSARSKDSIMSLSDGGDGSKMVAAYCSFTKESSMACTGSSNLTTTSSSSAITYKKDKYWNAAATIPTKASVLLISSQPDARTPQKYADRLLAALNGTNKALFTPNYRAHGSLWRSPIDKFHKNETTTAMDTLVAYVQNSGDLSKLSIAYGVGGIPSYAVTVTEVSELLFLTTDAFEGSVVSGDGVTSTSNSSTLIVVIVLSVAVILLLGVGGFYCQRRKNARLQAEATPQDLTKAVDTASPSTVASYELETRV